MPDTDAAPTALETPAFGALIGAATLVCMIRRRWVWVTASVLVVGLPQVLWIAAVNGPEAHLWTLGPVLFALLWGATMFVAIAIALVRDRWTARRWLKRPSK